MKTGTKQSWAIVLNGKIMEVHENGRKELYDSYDQAASHVESIRQLVWVKGKPKVVPVEIRILS